MAQFKFNLQAVLRQRELVEQERQRELAEVQRRYAKMEAELHQMDRQVKDATEQLRQNHLVGRIDVEYLTAHRRFTLSMQRRAMEQAERMAVVRKEMEEARVRLVEAARHRKAMEKLKEKRQEDWQVEQSQIEAAHTDEVVQQMSAAVIRASRLHPETPQEA